MKASVVITNHNDGPLLWKTVQSCIDSSRGIQLEVVVADDASTDGSIEVLLRRFPDVIVHRHADRLGVSPTKDAAIRESTGEVFILLDAHCNPERGALERLVRDVVSLDGQDVVAPCVPRLDVRRWQNSRDRVGYGFSLDLKSLAGSWVPRRKLSLLGKYFESPGSVGCCLAMSRELYEKLRGFDRGMIEYGLEDLDFGLKAWLMGHRVLVDPEAVIGHRFRRGGSQPYAVAPESESVNRLRMARKNFTEAVWEEWLDAFRARFTKVRWGRIQRLYQAGLATLERERRYLHERRAHSEYWFAAKFGLAWPRRR